MVREIYDLFVEVGRICYVDGKLVVIVDIVDHNRVLVTSPGAKRSVVSMSKLTLTKQVISIRRMSKAKAVEADATFAKSSLGKKLAKRAVRAGMTDFDRFKLMVAKQTKNKAVAKELKALKKK